MENIKTIIEYIVFIVELIGIIVIVGGFFYALICYILSIQKTKQRSYKILRQELGKAILLGLEILVAGDIIETVLIEPTLKRAASLAIIVLIRTVLSLSIEFEISGKVPWGKNSVNNET